MASFFLSFSLRFDNPTLYPALASHQHRSLFFYAFLLAIGYLWYGIAARTPKIGPVPAFRIGAAGYVHRAA
jgi:hypothetical protein